METIQITTPIQRLSYQELTPEERTLIDAAKQATTTAYAPYSKFHVGAAILLADGNIVTGANQENAAFSSGTCAERTACFHAAAAHPSVPFKTIAIAAYTQGQFQPLPISPCGACRQALLEYETLHSSPITLLLYGQTCIYKVPSVASLLPLSFTQF